VAGSMAPMIGASAAAAAARKRMLAEEEEMTPYSREDLDNDWEFKIVRSGGWGIFGNPARLNRLLEEEARAGWVMVEKFDNSRIRFKRPRSARVNDANLLPGVDPYRVDYGGVSSARYVVLFIFIALILVGVFLFMTFSIVNTHP
jgi:hypothetical protein